MLNFDPTSAEFQSNPFPTYARLREEDPLHWSEKLGGWVATGYRDVKFVLGDARFSADRITPFMNGLSPTRREAYARLGSSLSHWIVFNDPPRHTRLRGLQNKAFAPQRMAELRPRVEQIVREILDSLRGRAKIDFIADVAYPLPVTVMAMLLGVPTRDLDQFKFWSDELALFIGSATSAPDKWERAQSSLIAMEEYFTPLIEARRANPQDDLLTTIVRAEDSGARWTPQELLTNTLGLLFAGHETTTNLLGNGLFSLLRHPDQLDWLRQNPARIPEAIEELLRYDGPVGAIVRIAKEDVAIGDRTMISGQRVFAMINAANRDPLQFRNSDLLDLKREDNTHITFGHGIHYCVGAPLARLEGVLLFEELLSRYPTLEIGSAELKWSNTLVLRGLKSLPLRMN